MNQDAPNSHPVLPYGTSLVDRMNIVIHLRRYLKVVGRRWYILALCTLVGVGLYVYKANQIPNTYRAASKLGLAGKIETRSGNAAEAEYQEALETYYQDQIENMKGRPVLEKVEERMRRESPSASGSPPTPTIHAARQPGSSTWLMTVESTDFKHAQMFAKVWAEEFLKFKEDRKNDAKLKKAGFTSQEILRLEDELRKTRAATQQFMQTNKIGSAKETGDFAQNEFNELFTKLTQTQTLRKQLENKSKEEIANSLSLAVVPPNNSSQKTSASKPASASESDPMEKFSDSKYAEMKLNLMSKDAELKRRLATLKPAHPYLVRLNLEIEQLRQGLADQLEVIEDRRKALIASLKKDEEVLTPIIEDKRKTVLASSTVQHEYKKLEEEEIRIKDALIGHQKTLQAIEGTTSSEEQIYIVEAGIGSPLPVGPNRLRLVLTGLLLGLSVGLGLIYLLHRLDDRLELAEDIEAHLEEPLLGQIPLVDPDDVKNGFLLITNLDQHNLFAESIRGVRSAVLFGGNGANKKVMIVTSAVPGDGKTTFTVNFAVTLAKAGHRVLLIDADLRRGNTCHYFSHPRAPGLTEILTGELHWTDAMKSTAIKTLHTIHTGQLPDNPGELLVSPVMREFLEEAKRDFDQIIIDCPPLTAIDDTFSLVSMADGILFVVRAGQTSMRFAKNALAAVRQRGAHILGLVLNGITSDNPSYYYANYYHSYYTRTSSETVSGSSCLQPAAKMASPRISRYPLTSIQEEARVAAGRPVPSEVIAAEERTKTELYKARRAKEASRD